MREELERSQRSHSACSAASCFAVGGVAVWSSGACTHGCEKSSCWRLSWRGDAGASKLSVRLVVAVRRGGGAMGATGWTMVNTRLRGPAATMEIDRPTNNFAPLGSHRLFVPARKG